MPSNTRSGPKGIPALKGPNLADFCFFLLDFADEFGFDFLQGPRIRLLEGINVLASCLSSGCSLA